MGMELPYQDLPRIWVMLSSCLTLGAQTPLALAFLPRAVPSALLVAGQGGGTQVLWFCFRPRTGSPHPSH